jgi:hypothetical protein
MFLQIVAGVIHFSLVGGLFAAISALLWLLLGWCGALCGCSYEPTFFEAAGMLAFGCIIVRSSAFAQMQGAKMRRAGGRRIMHGRIRRHSCSPTQPVSHEAMHHRPSSVRQEHI